jgi:RNA polymerase sigma-70 factor (ECF subfamily)
VKAATGPFTTVVEQSDVQFKIPDSARLVSRVGESTESKRSLGGSGHAVRFGRPSGTSSVVAVQIFASRYGYPQPPDEDFHVYLLDQDRKVIKDLAFPYSTVKRTSEMRWYTLPVPKVDVPDDFYVALSFNPHRTKGIYLGFDPNVEGADSYVGLPDRGFEKVSGYEWMVRVCLSPAEE